MMSNPQREGELVRRFSAWRIAEHWVLIFTFLVLAVTGLAQKFHTVEVSRWLIDVLGGISHSRLIHHSAGIVFILLLLQHIIVNSVGILLGRWAPSMLISLKDFQDALSNVKYYLGVENKPAQCDRYDYKEKFVYWLMLVGGLQMAATGLMLWFPVLVARYLPGQFIPAAKIMHTNEAMLIFLLVAIWHIYDSMFSPEVFPIDTSIFTGYINRKRMEASHPLEYVRMDDFTNEGDEGMVPPVTDTPRSINSSADGPP
jgi:formate dehydrogenase subunit gamma